MTVLCIVIPGRLLGDMLVVSISIHILEVLPWSDGDLTVFSYMKTMPVFPVTANKLIAGHFQSSPNLIFQDQMIKNKYII